MWVVRIRDSNTRYEQLVREYFYDGAILYFDNEEDAVRMAVLLTKVTLECFGVQCVAQRLSSDPRKERMKRVAAAQINRAYENLMISIG